MRPGTRQLLGEHARQGAPLNWPVLLREAGRLCSAIDSDDLPIQRCTVHKHRNLLGHAPKRLHDELTEDYRDMIYADTAAEIETRRKAFGRKWHLKCRAVADSLEEAGDRLFAFTRLSPSQWKSARTTNAIDWTCPGKVEGRFLYLALLASNVIGALYPSAECRLRGL